jgi:hypothetical protein
VSSSQCRTREHSAHRPQRNRFRRIRWKRFHAATTRSIGAGRHQRTRRRCVACRSSARAAARSAARNLARTSDSAQAGRFIPARPVDRGGATLVQQSTDGLLGRHPLCASCSRPTLMWRGSGQSSAFRRGVRRRRSVVGLDARLVLRVPRIACGSAASSKGQDRRPARFRHEVGRGCNIVVSVVPSCAESEGWGC